MDNELLIKNINLLQDSRTKEIEEHNALLINVGGYRGVGIVCNDGTLIDETFNNVIFKTLEIQIKEKIITAIFLGVKDASMSLQYGWLCMDFLSDKNRKMILDNPLNWFNIWKDLLGNSAKSKMIYDFVGEMKVLKILLKKNKNAKWSSINKGTFDLAVENEFYEVKSSIQKSETEVTIHSKYQLDIEDGKKVNLIFVRLEESNNNVGDSIDSLYNDLISLGYDKEELDKYLNASGYYAGKPDRYKKFNTLEIRQFFVDGEFPKITPASFKEEKFPVGIKNIEYTVSLDGLHYTLLED